MLAILLPAFTLLAAETTVSDLAGQWHGKSHFNGISYEEATQKKIAVQDVETVLHISADGKVTGLVGGAELSGSVMETHRGWFWRLLRMKTNFIIEGQIVGAVVSRSESGIHSINAPFTFDGTRIAGSIYVTYAVKYPYPFLSIHLSH
ncbi:MAG: hypothetical protein ABSE97_09350 [Verrucomicrobiota bacterium]|jgi:hypothetical protein